MTSCNVTNSYFTNGFIHYPGSYDRVITLFDDIIFENNTSYRGTILNMGNIVKKENFDFNCSFNNVIFKNNTAENFGGVIYSEIGGNIATDSISFTKCTFVDNSAERGNKLYIFI